MSLTALALCGIRADQSTFQQVNTAAARYWKTYFNPSIAHQVLSQFNGGFCGLNQNSWTPRGLPESA